MIELYEYQKKVISACKNDPCHSQLISMPTGTGKTITFLSLAKELNKKTLIIVHREELLKQTYEKAKLCGFAEQNISLVTAEKKEKFALLTIAMVQSLSRNIEKYNPEDIEVLIIDEAHHATAPSYKLLIKYFKIFEEKKLFFGFTATPLRGDRDHLGKVFFSHSFKMTLSEATRLGYIVPVHGIRIGMEKSLKDIDNSQGDYDLSQLDKVMNCDSMNQLIIDRCKFLNKTPSIIFCTSVEHAEKLALGLRNQKRKAISISYKTPKKTCEIIYRLLKQGRIEFITNAVKLSEGFDHPALQSVILARPTRSPVLYKQMIGRGLRNFKNKFDCYVLEFTSNDPKMMKWEDIDETCTFQSSSEKEKKTEKEARNHYEKLFFNSDKIQLLDIRISPFEFYECKIRRYVKYKKFYYIPFTEGFSLYEVKNAKDIISVGGNYFNVYASMFFWKETYKSFYAWNEYNLLMNGEESQSLPTIMRAIKHYTELNKLGKWYPSDLQQPTREQKIILKKYNKNIRSYNNARKTEIEIEDMIIKSCIDKYMSKGHYSGIMEI
ncbi:MAG TPA: DEAD/DEAH box helicase [Candidatus Nitrosopolaris rasttigaisensis]|nr:DEAD/DEAH box helicase [Candidatus Nitrosopolaris rasttigaisensis]